MHFALIFNVIYNKLYNEEHNSMSQGGRTRLPKSKFSANFPIGLHVILQVQIKKIQKCLILCEKIF